MADWPLVESSQWGLGQGGKREGVTFLLYSLPTQCGLQACCAPCNYDAYCSALTGLPKLYTPRSLSPGRSSFQLSLVPECLSISCCSLHYSLVTGVIRGDTQYSADCLAQVEEGMFSFHAHTKPLILIPWESGSYPTPESFFFLMYLFILDSTGSVSLAFSSCSD